MADLELRWRPFGLIGNHMDSRNQKRSNLVSQDDTPTENVLAMYRVATEYGPIG